MIPIRDGIPTRETPVVNYLLIAANVLVFLWMLFMPESALETMVNKYAMVPAHFADGVTLADMMTIFTSMFMHAGLAHIGGNMLYLWIFGDNVEDRLGHCPLPDVLSGGRRGRFPDPPGHQLGFRAANRWGQRRNCGGAWRISGAFPGQPDRDVHSIGIFLTADHSSGGGCPGLVVCPAVI